MFYFDNLYCSSRQLDMRILLSKYLLLEIENYIESNIMLYY